MPAPLNLAGHTFGRLTALSVGYTSTDRRKWLCQCTCGKTTNVSTNMLTSGRTSSCGCLRQELAAENGRKGSTTHGRSKIANLTYSSWCAMRYRCSDLSNDRYGGRGISYCERWNSFELFLEDMGERADGTTLDRIDPNGNYEPSNCKWSSAKHQQRNRRNTRYIYVGGEKVGLMDIADQLGIKKAAAQYFFSVAKILEEYYGCVPSVKNGGSVAG